MCFQPCEQYCKTTHSQTLSHVNSENTHILKLENSATGMLDCSRHVKPTRVQKCKLKAPMTPVILAPCMCALKCDIRSFMTLDTQRCLSKWAPLSGKQVSSQVCFLIEETWKQYAPWGFDHQVHGTHNVLQKREILFSPKVIPWILLPDNSFFFFLSR